MARKTAHSAVSRFSETSLLPPRLSRASQNAELVERMRTDPVGMAPVVYARFVPVVNRLVWRLLGNDPEQNDIVQQVAYRILRDFARLRKPEKIDSWIRVVVANTVYKLLRSRRVRRLFMSEYQAEIEADLVPHVETRDLLLRIRAVLERLPAEERIPFVLHYVEERTLPEIARMGGYSLATAKRKVRKANQHFQFLLSKNREVLQPRRGE
jgi:RNA polymerase sigma-70 factor, ECF subfamily